MNYGEQLIQSLWGQKELEKQGCFAFVSKKEGRFFTGEINAEGIQLWVCVEDIGRYGLLLRELDLAVVRSDDSEKSASVVEWQANRLCDEIPYLDGKFQRVEVDRGNLDVLLRTEISKGDEHYYFELEILAGKEARLRRYVLRGDPAERMPAVANLSIETFRKLVDRLIEIFRSVDSIA